MPFIQKFAFLTVLGALGCATLAGPTEARAPVKDLKVHWITVATDPHKTYDLVRYTVADLGFKQAAGLHDILSAASLRGLDPCPDSLGIPIRLQYGDQPEGEVLYLGMNEVMSHGNTESIYRMVTARYHTIMDTTYVGDGIKFEPYAEFIFLRRP